jgi:formylglycine-generating enzyme required for sulfatase activity
MRWTLVTVAALLSLAFHPEARAGTLKCPPDSIKVGNTCIDTYKASVWQVSPSNTALVKRIQQGKVTLADLTAASATQIAPAGTCTDATDYGIGFPANGNWLPVSGSVPPSPGVYAVSIPGVQPSGCATWFQANQACALSGKRLLRNGEWQRAAAGTPDPGTDNGTTDCAVASAHIVNSGSRSSCKSVWGVFDMVGNVFEWVEDWADQATGCGNWPSSFGTDRTCFGDGGSPSSGFPAALVRGGTFDLGTGAGIFAVDALDDPSTSTGIIGFRCAR